MEATIYTGDLGRAVTVREGTTDRQVWSDTFVGRYHLPPADMPIPRTVLDLGANIGLTAAHYATLWPEAVIVAVELDEACANMARLNAPTVDVRCHAVSGFGGWGTYDHAGDAHGFAFTPGGSYPPREGLRMVSSYTLRQVIRRCFLADHVDFVKMDIEGEEWTLFEPGAGTWAPLVRHLLVELHGPDPSDVLVERAIRLLSRLGFTARHHVAHPQAVYAYQP